MDYQELIHTSDAILRYYPEWKIVHHRFLRTAPSHAFREVLLKGLELLKDGRADKWLSDDRENKSLVEEDAAWVDEFFAPMAFATGWKCWAMLLPESSRAEMTLRRLVRMTERTKLKFQVFVDDIMALDWLKGQDMT